MLPAPKIQWVDLGQWLSTHLAALSSLSSEEELKNLMTQNELDHLPITVTEKTNSVQGLESLTLDQHNHAS